MKKIMGTIFILFLVNTGNLINAEEVDMNVPENWNTNELKEIKVDDCNLSGKRKSNVIVDIGYGDRQYYAKTNASGQLTDVYANEIVLQEPDETGTNDRYCSDEAKVSGVEDENLDEGHVIADSLGGVSNSYNITPQNSTLNRSGEQSEMEEEIRTAEEKGKEVTEFKANIIYETDKETIPIDYKFSYLINGKEVEREFKNGFKEEKNKGGIFQKIIEEIMNMFN